MRPTSSGFCRCSRRTPRRRSLHSIWLKYQPQYDELIEHYHDPVAKMITATDVYLRMPLAIDPGRNYTIYLEPMISPGQVNSRDYRDELYYMVISPQGDNIHIEQLRHAYLHFVLDPLIAKRATTLERLKPMLTSVQRAPMAEVYKEDVGLLIIESLIRAIEARTPLDAKLPDQDRQAIVKHAESEGFILTGYFYDQLRNFEEAGGGAEGRLPGLAARSRRGGSAKACGGSTVCLIGRAGTDAGQQAPSLYRVDQAERALASGNPTGAAQFANEALAANDDPGRAYFVLARVATLSGNLQDARDNFAKAMQSGQRPASGRLVSHISGSHSRFAG